MLLKALVDPDYLRPRALLPYSLRELDFRAALQDVYDFFFDVNTLLRSRGLARLDETLRPENMSGLVTDVLKSSMAKHSRTLVQNRFPNGHPDLVVGGVYAQDRVQAGEQGIEIKTTRKRGGAVDTHGARDQWLCVFVYSVDTATEPIDDREPLMIREIYLAHVTPDDFRRNARGELGTRTATLHRAGLALLRANAVYLDPRW